MRDFRDESDFRGDLWWRVGGCKRHRALSPELVLTVWLNSTIVKKQIKLLKK
jgi:hypothetical protein